MRQRPEPKVISWIAAQPTEALFLSVVSIGELESGFITMEDDERRQRLEAWLERLLHTLFQRRVLPLTQAIAVRWGRIDGTRRSVRQPVSAPDAMIAATALEHDLTVVTRNVKHFAGCTCPCSILGKKPESMGLFDEIRWDAALPEGHPADDRLFQTKSLDPSMLRYVVTAEGRLLLVGHGWDDEPPPGSS